MDLDTRALELSKHLLGPLLLGGEVVPQRPFGPRLAAELGVQRRILDDRLRTEVDDARLRVARALVAVDVLPPLSPPEWALAAGLNDLLQVTNHELSSFATRGRHDELLGSTAELVASVPLSRTLEEAVARHGTFSRALTLRRIDTHISWWTGSDTFRGQPAPPRLLAWPGLRNVQVREDPVNIVHMAEGTPIAEEAFLDVLGAWLACSPLTDFATAFRVAPAFRWSAHTLSLVSTLAGCNLALRALSSGADDKPSAADAAIEALDGSTAKLPDGEPKQLAERFCAWVRGVKDHWADED